MVLAHPQPVFAVQRQAIRPPQFSGGFGKQRHRTQSAFDEVLGAVDGARRRIDEVHRMAILRPGKAGGQGHVVVDHLVVQLPVEAEQRPGIAAQGLVHQPGNEASLRVAGAVVEAVG